MSEHLRSEFVDESVESALELAGGKGLWALLGQVLAETELELELDLDDAAVLNTVVELVSWGWEGSDRCASSGLRCWSSVCG